jgi:hypothetical protein
MATTFEQLEQRPTLERGLGDRPQGAVFAMVEEQPRHAVGRGAGMEGSQYGSLALERPHRS